MADVAADVPGKFDVVIDGHGYILSNTVDQSLPFRVQRGSYSFSPTFLERTNVQGNYGDDQQAFWQTYSQNDWSGGEQQRFYRSNDADKIHRYWRGTNIDTSTPGQVSIRPDTKTNISFSSAALGATGTAYTNNKLYVADSTKLYSIAGDGTKTDLGVHGAGTPFSRGLVSDGNYVYVSGTTALRAYNIAVPAFTTFNSFTNWMALAYMGNTLYAIPSAMASLYSFSTAGVQTALYNFQDAQGGSRGVVTSIKSFGGQILLLRATSEENRGSTLWQYAGTGASTLAELPPNFRGDTIEVLNGVVFIAGAFITKNSTTYQPAIFYYLNGSVGLLWKSSATTTNTTVPAMVAFQQGLVFTDETVGSFLFYDITTGSISTIGSFSTGSVTWTNATSATMAASGTAFIHTRNSTSTYFFPDSATASSGAVYTSLVDLESSLTKLFRAIVVDYSPATDGDGGSVDIAYQVDSLDGAYTNLVTGATTGAENLLTSITGRSISVRVTLNKGTSTAGPVLKRIYVRAVPTLRSLRLDEFIIDCSGINGKNHVKLRHGADHPLDGFSQGQNLRTSTQSTSPISITDRFGTFTGVIEPDGFELIEVRPEEFVARVKVREV